MATHDDRARRRDLADSPDNDKHVRQRSRDRDSRDHHRRRDSDRAIDRRTRDESNDEDRIHKRRRRSYSPGDQERRRRRTDRKLDDRRSKEHHDHRRDRPEASKRRRRSATPESPPSRRKRSPSPLKRSNAPLPSQNDAFTGTTVCKTTPPPEKQKSNFSTTGRLAAESNTIKDASTGDAIVLKYHEPPEARKPSPKEAWRIYVFKGPDILETIELWERSCWLIGREQMIADFPVEHPSCSKQHAVIQFRYVEKKKVNEFGDKQSGKVRPYVIDLESANGTSVNGDAVPGGRYVELRDKDVLRFGLSSREYVLMLPPAE